MSSTTEQRSELRLRTRTTLDHLETKDLCNQSSIGLQRLCDRCTNPADLALVLKEVVSGLACASAQARRVRYKVAATAIMQRAADWAGPSIPSLAKYALERVGQEEQQSNQEELAGLLKAMAVAVVAYNSSREGQQKEPSWFGKLFTEPLLKTAASGAGKQRVATSCMLVHAVLTAVLEWANYQPVVLASVECLRTMLHYLSSGLLVPRVPEVYLPLKQCIEILGAGLKPRSAQAIVEHCLQGLAQKEDWQLRRQAVETVITLAAAVQVHKPQADGQWQLEVTSCVEVLVRNKPDIMKALSDAKYDKITHVRQAVGKALVEMDCIPSPRSVPSLAQALSAEDSDLNSLLAAKAAKRNSQTRSDKLHASSPSFRSPTRGGGSEEEDVCNLATSPESDQGRHSPHSPPMPAGKRGHALRHSQSMQKGPRRGWSPESSSLSLGRTPLGHVTHGQSGSKARASTGNLKHRKENQTPLERRSQFVKPKRHVFADFGVQVFAPLPRPISPEREMPPPSQAVEDDHVSIGPLRLQLPDLAASASKDRATADDCTTVLLDQLSESPNQSKQDCSSDPGATDKARPASEDAPQDLGKNDQVNASDKVEQSRQTASRTGSKQLSSEQQAAASSHQTVTTDVAVKPHMHVDRIAGIVSVGDLAAGSSVKLVGLQHAFQHAMRLEVTAPSDRGTDHFSFEIPADQLSQTVSHQTPHAVTSEAMQSLPSAAGDPSTPGQTLTPPGLATGCETTALGHSAGPTRAPSASAENFTLQQQQLSQLRQMAASAGLLLVPNSQSPAPALSRSGISPHSQHFGPLEQPQQQQQHLFSAYSTPALQQGPGLHTHDVANSMLAGLSGWQASPDAHAQQQPSADRMHHQLSGSTAHWDTSPGLHAVQQMGQAQRLQAGSADSLHWQPPAGPHGNLQQQQCRLPGWAQQALQQPFSNSAGYSQGSTGLESHMSNPGNSFVGSNMHALSLQQQHSLQPGSAHWLQHVSQQQHLAGHNKGDTVFAQDAAHMQPRLTQAWDIPAHGEGQQGQGANWSAAHHAGFQDQRQSETAARPVLRPPSVPEHSEVGLGTAGDAQRASSQQHTNADSRVSGASQDHSMSFAPALDRMDGRPTDVAMDHARNDIQAGSDTVHADARLEDKAAGTSQTTDKGHRAQPRGLPSNVQQTVSSLSDKPSHAAQAEVPSAEKRTQQGNASVQGGVDSIRRHAMLDEQETASSAESSPHESRTTGQDRPSVSPVRQSQPQTALSNASTPGKGIHLDSIAQPIIDMNVICNPLFTEPTLQGHAGSVRQRQGIGRSPAPGQHLMPQQTDAPVDKPGTSSKVEMQPGLTSPPSQLQQSLRKLMQRHTEGV